MSGETFSCTVKRGILMKALCNEVKLYNNMFRNTGRHDMREEVI